MFGANKAFLERQLPHIAAHMRASVEEVLEQAEVIVVANGSLAFRQVPGLLREDQVLVDLVGVGRANGHTKGAYDGIAW